MTGWLSRNTEQALLIYRELEGRLESCDIPNLDKFTLTLFMAIADRERELIELRTKQALDQKRLRVGNSERVKGGPNEKKAAAGLIGAQTVQEMACNNKNSRRATALIDSLRQGGQSYPVIAKQLNQAGFKTPRGKSFIATQVRRLHLKGVDEPISTAVVL